MACVISPRWQGIYILSRRSIPDVVYPLVEALQLSQLSQHARVVWTGCSVPYQTISTNDERLLDDLKSTRG